jgi:hypothetical protein
VTLNGNGLARRYGRLTPDERVRAALEASARGDFEERDRLIDSCPQRDYRMSDHVFMDRLDASRDLAMMVALELSSRMAQARMLDASAGLATRCVVLGAHAVSEGFESVDEPEFTAAVEEPFKRMYGEMRALLVAGAVAVYEAFTAVCHERLGVEPETVLLAHVGPPHVERLGLEILQGASPDESATGAWRDLFERRIGAG